MFLPVDQELRVRVEVGGTDCHIPHLHHGHHVPPVLDVSFWGLGVYLEGRETY